MHGILGLSPGFARTMCSLCIRGSLGSKSRMCFPEGRFVSKHGLWFDAGTRLGEEQYIFTARKRGWNETGKECVCVCERVTRPEWKVEEGKGIVRKDCLPSLLPTHPCHDLEITCCWVPVIAPKGRAHRVSCYSYFNRVGSCPRFLYFRRIFFRFGETTTFTQSPEGLPRISVSVHLMLQRDLGSWRCFFAS